jgi:hypothetical protein
MALASLNYKQRAQIAILAGVALRTVDRYFTRRTFFYQTAASDKIATALRTFGRGDLVRSQ